MVHFESQITEVDILMGDGLYITSIARNESTETTEARISAIEIDLFTVDEWIEFSKLVEQAIQLVTKAQGMRLNT